MWISSRWQQPPKCRAGFGGLKSARKRCRGSTVLPQLYCRGLHGAHIFEGFFKLSTAHQLQWNRAVTGSRWQLTTARTWLDSSGSSDMSKNFGSAETRRTTAVEGSSRRGRRRRISSIGSRCCDAATLTQQRSEHVGLQFASNL